jgi:chemotaxis receptor (MCP) glutamine deamidase CheD
MAQGKASKYFDRHFQRHAMKILPGEFYATAKDEVIVTVLGSCVAACLLDPVAMVGGMNHFMLPLSRTDQGHDIFFAARYGAAAMEYLINDLLHHGADRERLVAKVFGGGKVMEGLDLLPGIVGIRGRAHHLQARMARQDEAEHLPDEGAVVHHQDPFPLKGVHVNSSTSPPWRFWSTS